MIIGFTGTRGEITHQQRAKLSELLTSLDGKILCHGDAIGADAEAHDLARQKNYVIHIHPCTLEDQRAFREADVEYQPKEPLDRNKDIVSKCNVLLAIPKGFNEEQRSGTWQSIRYARIRKRKTHIIFPDGTVRVEN